MNAKKAMKRAKEMHATGNSFNLIDWRRVKTDHGWVGILIYEQISHDVLNGRDMHITRVKTFSDDTQVSDYIVGSDFRG